jgi:hypothetical protein
MLSFSCFKMIIQVDVEIVGFTYKITFIIYHGKNVNIFEINVIN